MMEDIKPSDTDLSTPPSSLSSSSASSLPGGAPPPVQTLYVKNLNEKIKIEELKKGLYLLFSQFGNLLEVKAQRTDHLRGQAWLVYADLTSATKAIREMRGFSFYGKPLIIDYAKMESDTITKAKGSFVQRPKRKPQETTAALKAKRVAAARKAARDQIIQQNASQQSSSYYPNAPSSFTEPPAPPHHILFIEQIPLETTVKMLDTLFGRYGGYRESRLVSGRGGIAFVEYENERDAAGAKDALQGFLITPTHPIKISFAKK